MTLLQSCPPIADGLMLSFRRTSPGAINSGGGGNSRYLLFISSLLFCHDETNKERSLN